MRSMVATARELVERLAHAAPRYAAEDREEKLRLLDLLARSAVRSPRTLHALHEALCFLQAYPDDAAVLDAVDAALGDFAARVGKLGARARALHDSGIDGTSLDYPFGFPMARWLAARVPAAVDVLWKKFAGAERIQDSLWLLLSPEEHDAFGDEGGLGWRRWLDAAKDGRPLSDLGMLLELFERAESDAAWRDWLFESVALPIGWRLAGPGGSRTRARLEGARPALPAAGAMALRRLDEAEFRGEIERPLTLRRADPVLAAALIDAALLAMATRLRELFAFSHANPGDVLVAEAGGGLRIALIGILPAFRLPFEGYYAYLALQHGVPVGYGAAWQVAGSLELAVNVFETFRRGESAFIVSQVLRAYRRAFGVEAVFIDPYQIGLDNKEALQSGAFYFYYYLGFRPRDPGVGRLAEAERAKIVRDAAYRSPLSVLRELARSELVLPLSPRHDGGAPRLTAAALSALVTADIGRRFRGDRRAAARAATRAVASALGLRNRPNWPRDERRAFERLSLLVTLIPDLARWPPSDRRRLVELMRARGGKSEGRYVRLLGEHRRLVQSLRALIAASDQPPS
jgi:hypothetical protein